MIPREAVTTLQRLSQGFPILSITGPRQSGKTTLARALFGAKPYISLENPQEREFAELDPQRFLARFSHGLLHCVRNDGVFMESRAATWPSMAFGVVGYFNLFAMGCSFASNDSAQVPKCLYRLCIQTKGIQ